MKLETEFIKLPFLFETERLQLEAQQFTESDWCPHPQGHPGNSALPLVAAHGDPHNDDTKGPMLPTPFLAQCPYLQQVLAAFGTVIGRTRLMRLDGNAEATRHVDTNYYWLQRARVHVPILTTPEVTFQCGPRALHMAAGEAWIFDTWQPHNVINPHPTRRIHLVADTVGSATFWDMVSRSERPFDPARSRSQPPQLVPFRPDTMAALEVERANQPVVMSPWEQDALLNLLSADLGVLAKTEHATVMALRKEVTWLRFHWRGLWAQFGESSAGWPSFRAALQQFQARLQPFARRLRLPNNSDVVEILLQMLVRPALNPDLVASPNDSKEWRSERPLTSATFRLLRNKKSVLSWTLVAARHSGRAMRDPESRGKRLDSRLRGNDGRGRVPVSTSTLSALRSGQLGMTLPQVPMEKVDAVLAVERKRTMPTVCRFERPIFIMSPPRSGSTLLFETLARSPSVYTIGGESHAIIENIPALHPANRRFDSNRLEAADADPATAERLMVEFSRNLRDRDGKSPAPQAQGMRLLEKTPKNALRIPFFDAIFPDAFFIYLYRDPWGEVSSIMEAWRSGRFVTYPQLPEWQGLPWSLVLTPGWRNLIGKPLEEIAASQWATTTRCLLDDLERIPAERWCVASYDRLVADPQTEIERLCTFVEIEWDEALTAPLPFSHHTLTAPEPDKWRRNAAELKAVMPQVAEVAARARDFFAQAPSAVPTRRIVVAAPAPALPNLPPPVRQPNPRRQEAHSQLRSEYTANFPDVLRDLRCSLLVSTYRSGHVVAVRENAGRLNTHFRHFQHPTGLAIGPRYLAIGTQRHVWEYRNQPAVAQKLDPQGKHDACFLPRTTRITGDIRIHELAFAEDELWLVNTRFSCLSTLDSEHSFVPRWRPRFVTHLAAEDRCHLTGLAVIDDQARFVTALGHSNVADGWREQQAQGGCVIDVESGEVAAAELSLPHSPRWYEGRFWFLESGRGTLSTLDLLTSKVETVVELPGFTRGLAFAGPYAFVGVSHVRTSAVGDLPVRERLREWVCGVWLVNIRTGKNLGFLRFADAVPEIFDVQVLAGIRFPELSDPDSELIAGSYVLPHEALAEVVP